LVETKKHSGQRIRRLKQNEVLEIKNETDRDNRDGSFLGGKEEAKNRGKPYV